MQLKTLISQQTENSQNQGAPWQLFIEIRQNQGDKILQREKCSLYPSVYNIFNGVFWNTFLILSQCLTSHNRSMNLNGITTCPSALARGIQTSLGSMSPACHTADWRPESQLLCHEEGSGLTCRRDAVWAHSEGQVQRTSTTWFAFCTVIVLLGPVDSRCSRKCLFLRNLRRDEC